MPEQITSRAELIAAIENGLQPEFTFFWGHTPKAAGTVGKWVFSQWFPVSFVIGGVTYDTAEHWMMAEKARMFRDEDAEQRIIDCDSPREAKAIGREVRDYDDAMWSEGRFSAVVEGNLAKFDQNTELREFLLKTGDTVLVEAAPRDTIWGIGLGEKNERARDPSRWRGQNLLGFALMKVREQLR